MTDGGGAKVSVHHESQSNDEVGSGKGSEAVCSRGGAQTKPRNFLAASSSESGIDRRLFRECGRAEEVTSWAEVSDRKSEWEVDSGGGSLIARDMTC